jgi:hypothetical protein
MGRQYYNITIYRNYWELFVTIIEVTLVSQEVAAVNKNTLNYHFKSKYCRRPVI